MFEKTAITSAPIQELLARRWSGRAYDAARPVPRADLVRLLEAARWAPSCFGDQPWRYLIWDRTRDAAAWQRAFDCLGEFNQSWAKPAPVLMAVLADGQFTHNGQPNRWAAYDCGAASMSLCVQATELGLMVHQMGGFDAEKLRRDFAIPERYTAQAVMTVGYQLPRDQVPPFLHEKEFAARQRRALGESFFEGAWAAPVDLF
jgi:nitroreductase